MKIKALDKKTSKAPEKPTSSSVTTRFNLTELILLVALAAKLDENEFPSPKAKSLILKCKSATTSPENFIGFKLRD